MNRPPQGGAPARGAANTARRRLLKALGCAACGPVLATRYTAAQARSAALHGDDGPAAAGSAPIRWRADSAASGTGPDSWRTDSAGIGTTPASWHTNSVRTSDGVRLNLLEESPAAAAPGPAIVLVPGWCMPATIWRDQLAVFGARWTTVAMDPRGQGASDIPAGGYTADRRADDLHDVLQAHERVVLVAWSLGVLDALQYVQRHGSSRLAGLVLVDNSIGEPPAPKGSDFLARLRRDRRGTVDRFVRSMFAHPLPDVQLAALCDSALRMPLESSIALLSYPLPREHWRDIVLGFDRPLAYLVTPRFAEQARHLQEARPRSRVEVFEGAGHALFVDAAERFNAVVMEWIAGLA